ncbi:MAG: hypothetical protein U5R06_04790 [candidate division KSB1 bacterium]|nr:hypothetical protein [candidate division KSB1 bacterium]
MVRCLFTFLLFLFAMMAIVPVNAVEFDHYFQNTLLARSFGMAGAVSALDHWPGTLLFNAAASPFMEKGEYPEFKAMLNPVTSLESLYKLGTKKYRGFGDLAGQAGLVFPFVSLNQEIYQISLMLTQPLPDNPHASGRALGDADALLDWHYHLITARLKLDSRVSIGSSGYMFVTRNPGDERHQTALGTSYSVMIRPTESYQAGISYYNIHEKADSLLFSYHRVIDNTLNVGVSFSPFDPLTITCDIRNVDEEENTKARELHTGLELSPNKFFSVRGGYYFNNSKSDHVFTAGIGYMDRRPFKQQKSFSVRENLMFQYGVQAIYDNGLNLLHYATLLIQL